MQSTLSRATRAHWSSSRCSTNAAVQAFGRRAIWMKAVEASPGGIMTGLRAWFRGLVGKKEPESDTSPPQEPPPLDWPRSFAEDHNHFTLALYMRLLDRDRNLFFSPFSIRVAFAMAAAGARGETAEEM